MNSSTICGQITTGEQLCNLPAGHLGLHRWMPPQPLLPDKYAHVRLEGLELKPGEPWFLLRGQDVLTPRTMQFYAACVGQLGKPEMAIDIARHAEAITAWQRENPQYVKEAD